MLIAQRPTLTEEVVDDHRSRFTIEPLEPGFGYTLGNSLRRTLLSSIPGASVTSIKIDGVLHEFSTISGVKEDVTEVILNLKDLVVSSEQDEPVTMYLRKQGPGEVTAADETTWRYVFAAPEDILLVCAGGRAGSWSACLPGWGTKWTRSVTELIPELATTSNSPPTLQGEQALR